MRFGLDCKKTFGEEKPLGVMRIGMDKAVFALKLLLEGMSIRATERLTGLHRDTLAWARFLGDRAGSSHCNAKAKHHPACSGRCCFK